MDEKLGTFIDDFAALVQLAQAGAHRIPRGEQLLSTLSDHLGVPAQDLPVVVEEIPAHRFVDADIVLADVPAVSAVPAGLH
ncbi:MAG TPA: hypothetical protein VIG41_06510 [Micrococcaceae bacterium]|jgi:hypothetical protein